MCSLPADMATSSFDILYDICFGFLFLDKSKGTILTKRPILNMFMIHHLGRLDGGRSTNMSHEFFFLNNLLTTLLHC